MVTVRGGKVDAAPTVYQKAGVDCSGADQTTNRTLDLPDEASNQIIFVQGSYLTPTSDYTSAVVGGVTRYTFLNKIYNGFKIIIYYWK